MGILAFGRLPSTGFSPAVPSRLRNHSLSDSHPSSKPTPEIDDRLYLQSVARTFRVLEALANVPRPPSLRELAQLSGLDKSAVQRIAYTLQCLGYMERDSQSGGIVPGRRLLDRSFDYLRSNPLIAQVTPVLSNLRKVTGERVDFSLFDQHTTLYALRMQSKRETFFATLIGRRIPSFASSGGRACLSHLPEEEARQIIETSDRKPITPRTLTDPDQIMARIAEAREAGYACALEESLLGEIVIGAAVLDQQGRPAGAIHIAGSLAEWDEQRFRRKFSPLLLEATRALSG